MARGVAGAVHPETYEVAELGSWILRGSFQAGRLRGIGFEFPVPEVIVLQHVQRVSPTSRSPSRAATSTAATATAACTAASARIRTS